MSLDQHPVDILQNKTESTDTPLVHPPESLTLPETKPSLWDSIGGAVRELVETLLLTLVIFLLIRFAMQNFRVEGFSMEPNFHDGQFLLVSKVEYMLHQPERGDVIVFRFPNQPSRDFIKRIIGLPGDHIDIRNGQVIVNNEPLPETYPLNAGSYTFGPVTVGTEEYFVLGDNRNNSSDSHSWGMMPTKNIIGKAWFSYWPPQWVGLVPHFTYAADQ